jgi:hypothetical protein
MRDHILRPPRQETPRPLEDPARLPNSGSKQKDTINTNTPGNGLPNGLDVSDSAGELLDSPGELPETPTGFSGRMKAKPAPRNRRRTGIKSGSAALTAAIASSSRKPPPVPSTTAAVSTSRPAYAPIEAPYSSPFFGGSSTSNAPASFPTPTHASGTESPDLRYLFEGLILPAGESPSGLETLLRATIQGQNAPRETPSLPPAPETRSNVTATPPPKPPSSTTSSERRRSSVAASRSSPALSIFSKEDLLALTRVRRLLQADDSGPERKQTLLGFIEADDSSAQNGRDSPLT